MRPSASVSMPEATVYENCLAPAAKHKIGRSRQIAPVQPVAVAQTVCHAANEELWLGVLAANAAHVHAALLWR